ncbi:MAG: anti-sigma factor [Methylocystaceae bacterium]|nr:MAG: anti-sigma factor [Methylocystaceae bacterium]
MPASEHVDESELHAFVDGELDAERRRGIEDHLHKNAEDAALVEGWRRQNAALRAAFAQAAKEPLPASLRASKAGAGRSFGSGVNWARFSPSKASSLRSMRRADTSRRTPRRSAVAVSILTLFAGAIVAGAALLAFTGPATPPDKAVRLVTAPGFVTRAHIAYLTFAQDARPVELSAEQRAELSAWLLERTGFGGLPDLTTAGLELLGGRLVPGVAGPAGLLLYETKSGVRVGLFFERAMSEAAPAEPPRATPGLTAVEWRAAGLAFVLLGPLSGEAGQAAAERAASEVLR